jgi:hypothetical protein
MESYRSSSFENNYYQPLSNYGKGSHGVGIKPPTFKAYAFHSRLTTCDKPLALCSSTKPIDMGNHYHDRPYVTNAEFAKMIR